MTSRIPDLYPTRGVKPQAAFPRLDPVVHGDAKHGPLPRNDVDRYREDGFLFLPDWLDKSSLSRFRHELRRLSNSRSILDRDGVITEPASREVRSIFRVHELSDVFAQLARHPALLGMAHQLLGSEVYIHQSRINYKPGFRGKGFSWHSDFETWHSEDGMPVMRALSMSLILTDNHAFNGPLMLIPGSHRVFVPCVGETPEDNYRSSLQDQKIGVPDEQNLERLIREAGGIQAPTGTAGSLLIFDCNTLHGSNANMSPDPRSNVFFVYNSVENTPVKPFSGGKPRPAFLAEREDFRPLSALDTALSA